MLPYCGPLDQIKKTPYQPSHGAKHMVKRSVDESYHYTTPLVVLSCMPSIEFQLYYPSEVHKRSIIC